MKKIIKKFKLKLNKSSKMDIPRKIDEEDCKSIKITPEELQKLINNPNAEVLASGKFTIKGLANMTEKEREKAVFKEINKILEDLYLKNRN